MSSFCPQTIFSPCVFFKIDTEENIVYLYDTEYQFSDIIDYVLIDNSSYQTVGESYSTQTSTGSMIGRAIVGGLLFGEVGALIGGATAGTETVHNPGIQVKNKHYLIQVNVNNFQNPSVVLDFKSDYRVANLVSSYLKIIVHRNKLGEQRDAFKLYRLLHELKMFKDEGLMADEEYQREVKYVKDKHQDSIELELKRVQEDQLRLNRLAERKRLEEDNRRRLVEEENEKRRIEEEKIAQARLEYDKKEEEDFRKVQEKNALMQESIRLNFANKKSSVVKLNENQIMSADYSPYIKEEGLKMFDVIRYLIAEGQAAAAGKYYVDKSGYSAADAKEYMLGLFSL